MIASLLADQKAIFNVADAVRILKTDQKSAASFVSRLVKRGIVTRLKGGLYQIVPFELGTESTYMGDVFLVMAELAAGQMKDPTQYFLSHASAMELHQMVTQPQFVVYATVPRSVRRRTVLGTDFRFVASKPAHFFGFERRWLTKTKSIQISDLERTLIDGLRLPDYCGGIVDVAKGLWVRQRDVSLPKLIEYADRVASGAVFRRLGYLLSLYGIGQKRHWDELHSRLSATYHRLDSGLPNEGKHIAKWRLRLNIPEHELLEATSK